jgi:uncharacterized protein
MSAIEQTIVTPHGDAQGLWLRPVSAAACYVLAHGAGAGMQHSFMTDIAERLCLRSVATLRYEFLYMSAGRNRPDREPVLLDTVRSAAAHARRIAPDLPQIAGGKSMGGRMTSRAAAAEPLNVGGIAFIGFPLHPPKRVSTDRAVHLQDVHLPMLFLQGTRDDLADLPNMRTVTDGLGARAELHVVDGADHAFHVLKRSGRTDDEVMDELADAITAFAKRTAS